MQLCCQMCDIARVCSHPLTHGMHIKARFTPPEHLHSRFQQLLSSDGSSLALTETWTCPGLKRRGQEGVADWCGDHWHLQRPMLKEQSDNPGETQPGLFSCVDTVQSLLVLLWHSLSLPDDFPIQRPASCVRHTSVCWGPLRSRTGLTSATRLEPGTGETPACTDTFTGDQLPYRLTVSRVPLESTVPSERGQDKHYEAALVWWGQPRTRTKQRSHPYEARMSLFVTEGKVLTKAEKQKLEEISKDTEAKQMFLWSSSC